MYYYYTTKCRGGKVENVKKVQPYLHSLCIFNSIQFKIVYFQHNTYYVQQCFFSYDVLKRERAEDRAYVGSFPIICKDLSISHLLMADNDLNNHKGYCSCNVIAKLQTYKNKE